MLEVFFGIIVFLFMSIGLSHLWSHSSIFQTTRNYLSKIKILRKVLLCPECFSFWIGFALSFCFNPLAGVLVYKVSFLSHVLCGVITYLFASFFYNKNILE